MYSVFEQALSMKRALCKFAIITIRVGFHTANIVVYLAENDRSTSIIYYSRASDSATSLDDVSVTGEKLGINLNTPTMARNNGRVGGLVGSLVGCLARRCGT